MARRLHLSYLPSPNDAAIGQSVCETRHVTDTQHVIDASRAEKDRKREKYAHSKLHYFGFAIVADWLKQTTCLLGLILAPSIRVFFFNQ